MRKRIISVALALCLCISSTSMAYASQGDPMQQEDALTEQSASKLAARDSTIPTPTEAYKAMIALKDQDKYKEGTTWTNDEPYSDSKGYYHWKGGTLDGKNISAVGCVAFAFILSDAAFGSLPARMYAAGKFTYEDIKAGDILRVNNDSHTVIVLEASDAGVVVAEGNISTGDHRGKVHWGRAISKEEVMSSTSHYITRYPEGYVPPDDPGANVSIAQGTLAGGLRWNLTKAGTLTISGKGAMPDFASTGEQPWNGKSSQIRKIILENGVTNIGSCAFWNCGVLSAEIPSSVTAIGNSAFRGSSIISVTIPSNVKTLGDSVFQDCQNLSSVTISEGLETISQNAFRACSSLSSIVLPASIGEVGAGAFFQCQKLIRVVFTPGSKQVKLGDNIFTQCYYLSSVTLPKSINQISEGMFQNCLMLATLEIPQGAESIGSSAFSSCSSLTSIIIPNSVTTIGIAAFSASALRDIYFTGTQAQWNSVRKLGDTIAAVSKMTIHYNYVPEKTDISKATVTLEKTSYTYDGNAKTPAVTVNLDGKTLIPNTDYSVSYNNNTAVGTANVSISGMGNYSGNVTAHFTITKADISKAAVSLEKTSYTYDGSAKTPAVTVNLNGKTLVRNTDYSVSYNNNTTVGTANVIITGMGYYTGRATANFTITKADVSKAAVSLEKTSYTYDGSAKTPAVTVNLNGKTLVRNTDYTVSYNNNTAVGTANVSISGMGNYTGRATANFTITKADISKAAVSLEETSYTYDGSAKTPAVTVTLNGKTLALNTDYSVSYNNNIEVGTANVIITGMGNYTSSVTAHFTITKAVEVVKADISKATVTLEETSFTYDGSAKTPAVTVTLDGKTLLLNTDYSVSYNNNIEVGTADVSISGMGNYSGSATAHFTITKADISKAAVSLEKSSYTYDGSAKTPAVTVSLNDKTLLLNTDYSVSYDKNTEVGTADAIISGMGNYTGNTTATFTITKADISEAAVTLEKSSYTYDGSAKTPAVTVSLNDKTLLLNTDYSVSYDKNTEVGTADAIISGMGNYTGNTTATFTITKADISEAAVTLEKSSYTYDGSAKTPAVTVSLNDKTLLLNTDYSVSYDKNTEVGTADAIISGMGNYTGNTTATFTITKADISNAAVTLEKSSYTYDGSAKRPSVTVNLNGKTLVLNTDYSVSYDKNTEVGTADAIISGMGNYTGNTTATFTITKADISNAAVTLEKSSYTYDGSAKRPSVTVNLNGKTLVLNTDYSVSYNNNIEVGTADAIISGMGNYTGSATAHFTITKAAEVVKTDISNAAVTLEKTSFTYDGKAKTPSVTVTLNGKTLVLNTDYSVSYNNNIEVGIADAIISGMGNYTGSATAHFTITKAAEVVKTDISKATVTLEKTSFTYDGKAKTPSVTVTLNGKTLVLNTDYSVSYNKNTAVGTANVIISGMGNYTGSATAHFKITKASAPSITCKKTLYKVSYGAAPFKINASSKGKMTFTSSKPKIVAVNKNTGKVTIKNTGIATITIKAGKASKKVTVKVYPKKPSVKPTAAKGKKLCLKWPKDKRASGYKVQISTDKNFKKGVKSKNVSKTSYTFKKLKTGKKYYVRIRSYKKYGKEMLYSKWSKIKRSSKIKK